MLLFDPGARSTGLDFSPSERSTLWQNFFESEVGLRDASETTFFQARCAEEKAVDFKVY